MDDVNKENRGELNGKKEIAERKIQNMKDSLRDICDAKMDKLAEGEDSVSKTKDVLQKASNNFQEKVINYQTSPHYTNIKHDPVELPMESKRKPADRLAMADMGWETIEKTAKNVQDSQKKLAKISNKQLQLSRTTNTINSPKALKSLKSFRDIHKTTLGKKQLETNRAENIKKERDNLKKCMKKLETLKKRKIKNGGDFTSLEYKEIYKEFKSFSPDMQKVLTNQLPLIDDMRRKQKEDILGPLDANGNVQLAQGYYNINPDDLLFLAQDENGNFNDKVVNENGYIELTEQQINEKIDEIESKKNQITDLENELKNKK